MALTTPSAFIDERPGEPIWRDPGEMHALRNCGWVAAPILAVVTEIQASLPGLGSDKLYTGLIVFGMLGFMSSYTLQLIEGRLLCWRNPQH